MIRFLAMLAILAASMAASAPAAQRFIPLLEAGDAIPPIPLVGQDGRRFTLADWRGNAVAVSFIYTRCRDPRMCPLVAAKFARAQHGIGMLPIRLVVLTLDPRYDTPPVLARYGRDLGQDPRIWTLATGSPAMTGELAERLGISATGTEPGTFSHTEGLVILGPDGRIAQTTFGNGWSAADLIADATATLPGRSDPTGALRGWLSAAVERCGAAGLGPNGAAMLGILTVALSITGIAFWRAFGRPRAHDTERSG